MWKWTLVALLALCLAMTVVVACGDDDDDDDDDDGGGYSCDAACGVIYGCDYALVTEDGYELSEEECVAGCEDEGGVDSCSGACLAAFEEDTDCEALGECAYECF